MFEITRLPQRALYRNSYGPVTIAKANVKIPNLAHLNAKNVEVDFVLVKNSHFFPNRQDRRSQDLMAK